MDPDALFDDNIKYNTSLYQLAKSPQNDPKIRLYTTRSKLPIIHV